MTGKQLSEFLNVSDRTIRSDIACINLYYDGLLIESNNRDGYHINAQVLSSLNINLENKIPQTSFQRCFYIIHELLFKNNELNIVNLMDEIFISKTAMENDLNAIKKHLKSYPSLKIIRQKNYLSLEGNEESKRQLYVNLLLKKINGNFLNMDILAALFPDFDLINVKELLENIFKKYDYSVRKIEFPSIMAYIGVTIERLLSCNFIQTEASNENIVKSSEFQISKEFFDSISRKLNIKIKENEITFLAFVLLGRAQGDNKEMASLLNSNYPVEELVDDILEDIYTHFGVNFKNDKNLKEGLSVHIELLLKRKKNNIQISNLYLDELKYKYPFFFEIAVRVGKLIEDRLNVKIDENEISFIEQHLGGAFENMNSKNKYRVIMVNPNKQALSSLCIKKIESIFHERVEIIGSINYFEKKEVLKLKPDLILTTLPLEHNLNILTVKISIFVNSEDEVKIFQAINSLDSCRYNVNFISDYKAMMEPRFFYFDLDFDTSEKVINFMSDNLYYANVVDENFKDAVLKREELSPTSFIYSFAIPHPITAMSNESKISVAMLKKPIQWGNFQVKLVILLAIQKGNEKKLRTFFDWLSNVVNDSKKLSSLMKVKSYNEFISQIVE